MATKCRSHLIPECGECVFKCPEGTFIPTSCIGTEYQPDDSKGTCLPCVSTNDCTDPTTFIFDNVTYYGSESSNPCPKGYQCKSASYPEPCPIGTFGDTTGLKT